MNNFERNAKSISSSALLYRVFWRLHFWSGLLTAPIVLFAALTGIIYVFTPQIEAWKYGDIDQQKQISPALSLDQQLALVQQTYPNKTIKTIVPAYSQGETSKVFLVEQKPHGLKTSVMNGEGNQSSQIEKAEKVDHQEHQEHQATKSVIQSQLDERQKPQNSSEPLIVYVDPGTGQIQGSLLESDRFVNWSRKLHSNMLQGDSWRWLIELAASWMLMMMVTGIYLWWPRGSATWGSVLRWKTLDNSRANWRYMHSMLSVVTGILTITILVTGLTWAKYAGDNFRALQNATSQHLPRAPKNLQSTLPQGDIAATRSALSMQTIYQKAKQQFPDIQMQLSPPKDANGVWRIENYDRSQPYKRFQAIVDAYSGKVLFEARWDQLPILARATAVGIPFHRGEFGWWNQALLVLVGSSVIFSVISGYVMWLQRRKAASLSVPKINSQHAKSIPVWIWIVMLAMGIALPVFGVSLLLLLILESGFLYWQTKKLA